ncbi:hypothetical protein LINPERHAP1_LOCUS23343 [Linum perenne]
MRLPPSGIPLRLALCLPFSSNLHCWRRHLDCQVSSRFPPSGMCSCQV